MFEKVIERRPRFPEVEKQLANLRYVAELQRKSAMKRASRNAAGMEPNPSD